ncbi:hybrid sensor histidine kinase/response regulator transcription factor [Parapedobacter tibetensis]|uniref:hybrid sensor histidine kinase/response regulator transcription factor n=1 Tax=Parapedobacter tibetensis TaxID=2972951 RepID=UPI00214DD0C2|nr:hybrid sensor histidine kinase/response regulator transcription factor [Parapedobacter tibetensis]
MVGYIRYYLMFCVSLVWFPSLAQELSFEHVGRQAGLSSSTLECIIQDSRGFMWFGTRDGLNRYDGYEMRIYRHEKSDSTSLSNSYILDIYEDRHGTLWVGTINGLNRFDAKLQQFKRYHQNEQHGATLNNRRITSIAEDAAGRLWIGTWGGGLNLYHSEVDSFVRFAPRRDSPEMLLDDYVSCLHLDEDGSMWVGTQGGLFRMAGERPEITALGIHDGDTPLNVSAICGDKFGRLWIGTVNDGILVVDDLTENGKWLKNDPTDPTTIRSNQIRSIVLDRLGQMWIGTVNGGLNRFDQKNGEFYGYEHEPGNNRSLSQRTVSALCEDRQGNLWIGTHRGGVNLYSPSMNKFQLFRSRNSPNSLSYNDVRTFLEDEYGKIWIGTDGGGISVYDPNTDQFKQYRHDPHNFQSLSSDAVLHIFKDSQQRLWITTWGGGLNLFNPKNDAFIRFKHDPNDPGSISSNYVQQVIEDKGGNLWVGTYYGGLLRFNPSTKTFRRFTQGRDEQHKIYGVNVSTLMEDHLGRLWISTDDGGLNCYDSRTGYIRHYFTEEEHVPDIRVLYVDSQNRLWLGQRGLYLFHEEEQAFEPFTLAEGLKDEFIRSMIEDPSNVLWISTLNGVIRMDPANGTTRAYNVYDGLQDYEFEPNSVLKTSAGKLYFGGINGFNIIDPQRLPHNETPCPVYITGFQLFNTTAQPGEPTSPLKWDIEFTKQLELSHKQSSFSLTFAALNYHASRNNRYTYRLEGFDNDWMEVTHDRKASYTNLSPGKYRFRVKAANNDGVWNESGTTLDIVIHPPVWGTWWFKIGFATALAISCFQLYLTKRKRELRKIEAKKKVEIYETQLQFFTNISHEFRTPLSLISGPLEQLIKYPGSHDWENLQLIRRNTERLVGLVDELIDFRKVEDGAIQLSAMPTFIDRFVEEISDEFQPLAANRNINFCFQRSGESLEGWIDRQIVEKILLNLLNNAFKYTPEGGKITVNVLGSKQTFIPGFTNEVTVGQTYKAHRYFTFCISDTGIGISAASIQHLFERYYRTSEHHLGSGIGLAFVKSLTLLHRGHIKVYSDSNKGTEILVSLPCDHNDFANNERWEVGLREPTIRLDSIRCSVPHVDDDPVFDSLELENPSGSKPTILLIDDNEELRGFLSRCLAESYNILSAENGKEGLSMAIEHQPDAIISDVMMPIMNGIALCHHIKSNDATQHIPFIMLTAKVAEKAQISGMDSGADYYFPKPVNIELLKLTLRNSFQGRNILSKWALKARDAHLNATAKTEEDRLFIDKLKTVIESEMDNPELNVEFLCTKMGLSRTPLYQKTKKITGQPIGDFIRSIRLRHAADLLVQKNLTITEAMFRVGIQTQSHFTKAFKKEFGKTPARYLQDLQNGIKHPASPNS